MYVKGWDFTAFLPIHGFTWCGHILYLHFGYFNFKLIKIKNREEEIRTDAIDQLKMVVSITVVVYSELWFHFRLIDRKALVFTHVRISFSFPFQFSLLLLVILDSMWQYNPIRLLDCLLVCLFAYLFIKLGCAEIWENSFWAH